ncbi:hypothetical protein ACVBIL_07750 [Shewanella sp. 125m-7]
MFNKYTQNDFIHLKTGEEDSVLLEENVNLDEQEDETTSYILGYN